MSNTEFLDPQEAEKFKKQKWPLFCWTPCKNLLPSQNPTGNPVPRIRHNFHVCRTLQLRLNGQMFKLRCFRSKGGRGHHIFLLTLSGHEYLISRTKPHLFIVDCTMRDRAFNHETLQEKYLTYSKPKICFGMKYKLK